MIQVNLLPDVKAVYVKAERTKRTVITLAVIICGVAIGIVALLASVAFGSQALQLNNVQKDIDTSVTKINEVEDLDKILTIQNQLTQLVGDDTLHTQKPVVSKIFKYLQQTTPQDVRIDTFKVDFAENTMSIDGNAPTVGIINKYVDTLKFTQYIVDPALELDEIPRAFNNVILTDFAAGTASAQGEESTATFTIKLQFDPELFKSSNDNLEITVPKIITTRSETEQPGDLFKQNPESNAGGQQ